MFTEVRELLARINEAIIDPFIILLIALALFWFLWGVVMFVIYSGEPEKRKIGQQHMIWGIIGLVIMVSVFAIIRIVLASFGVDTPPDFPQ